MDKFSKATFIGFGLINSSLAHVFKLKSLAKETNAFSRRKETREKIRNLKLLISEKYKLPDTAIVSIVELTCHEPNCPPLETVITVRFEEGLTKNWRVAKPINEIEESNINDLESHSH